MLYLDKGAVIVNERNVKKYEKICERNRENGRKGGRPRLNKDESVNL